MVFCHPCGYIGLPLTLQKWMTLIPRSTNKTMALTESICVVQANKWVTIFWAHYNHLWIPINSTWVAHFLRGGSLKCYQSKTILKFFFYAAYISVLFVQHLTRRMDTAEVMHFHRTTQQSVFSPFYFKTWFLIFFPLLACSATCYIKQCAFKTRK